MAKITPELLKRIAPTISSALREEYVRWLNLYLPKYKITTELRIAAFFANIMEESGRLSRVEENLNYSAGRLRQVWPNRFPTMAVAQAYAGNPQKLANYVYGARNGNRGQKTNDGWIYRGGGWMQTTGRDNYEKTGDAMNLDLISHPEKLRIPQYAVLSACVEWARRGCNELADQKRLTETRKRINGGTNGLAHVQHFYSDLLRWLPDGFKLDPISDDAIANEKSVNFIQPLAPESDHTPDTVDAVDMGSPAWIEPEDQEPIDPGSESSQTGQDQLDGPDSLSGDKKPSEGQQTPGIDKPETDSGAAKGATHEDKAQSPQVIDREHPSLFSKVMTGIFGAIATAIASITATCGGSEVANIVTTKGAERVVDNADRSDLITLGLVLVYVLVGLGASIFLFWVASKIWEKAAERSSKLNLEKVKAAASKDDNTVEFKN